MACRYSHAEERQCLASSVTDAALSACQPASLRCLSGVNSVCACGSNNKSMQLGQSNRSAQHLLSSACVLMQCKHFQLDLVLLLYSSKALVCTTTAQIQKAPGEKEDATG